MRGICGKVQEAYDTQVSSTVDASLPYKLSFLRVVDGKANPQDFKARIADWATEFGFDPKDIFADEISSDDAE